MNLPQNVADCVCLSSGNPHKLCFGNNGFQEKKVQVKFSIKSNEELKSIILDGCLLTSRATQKSCDGLFLFFQANKIYILLIELKGSHHIEDAFEQLSDVKYKSQEYANLYKHIKRNKKGSSIIEKYFVITNGYMNQSRKSKLQSIYNIKVEIVTREKRKGAAPDLRKYVRLNRKLRSY